MRLPGTLADKNYPKPGRQHQSLLAAGYNNVHTPLVDWKRRSTKAGDSIHNRDGAMLLDGSDDLLEIVDHSGRRFVVCDRYDFYGFLTVSTQLFSDGGRVNSLSCIHHNALYLRAVCSGNLGPTLAEHSLHQAKHLVPGTDCIGNG